MSWVDDTFDSYGASASSAGAIAITIDFACEATNLLLLITSGNVADDAAAPTDSTGDTWVNFVNNASWQMWSKVADGDEASVTVTAPDMGSSNALNCLLLVCRTAPVLGGPLGGHLDGGPYTAVGSGEFLTVPERSTSNQLSNVQIIALVGKDPPSPTIATDEPGIELVALKGSTTDSFVMYVYGRLVSPADDPQGDILFYDSSGARDILRSRDWFMRFGTLRTPALRLRQRGDIGEGAPRNRQLMSFQDTIRAGGGFW